MVVLVGDIRQKVGSYRTSYDIFCDFRPLEPEFRREIVLLACIWEGRVHVPEADITLR